MVDEREMQDTFQHVGARFGFDHVQASYYPFKEFKTTWKRFGTTVSFKVTDYMQGAGEEVINDFAFCLFQRMQRRRRELYTARVSEYLCSDAFLRSNQEKYLKRSHNLTLEAKGKEYDLDSLLASLQDRGLVGDCHGAFLTWTEKPNRFRMGYCSLIMRVVAISSALDSSQVPSFVAEYVLYHEMLHLLTRSDPLRSYHDAEFRRLERRYPRWREAENWLRRLSSGHLARKGSA